MYIPGIGQVRNNARRWINIGISTLQPSEVVKIAIIIYFSYSLSLIKDKIKGVSRRTITLPRYSGAIFNRFAQRAALERDARYLRGRLCPAFDCGGKAFALFALGACALPLLAFMIYKQPYQLERVTTFLNPLPTSRTRAFRSLTRFTRLARAEYSDLVSA